MAIQKPILVRPLDLDNITASSEDTGHPVSNLADFSAIGLTWKTAASPASIWARGQFDGSRNLDFLAVIAANAQEGTQIRLRLGTSQAQVDGSSAPYDSGAVDFIDPFVIREGGLYHSHLEIPSNQYASWWRIDITGHTGAFEAAHVVLGKMARPSRFYDWDFEFGVEDLGGGEFTNWGVFDEQPGLIFRKLAFTLSWQSQAEFESTFRPMLERSGTRGMVYCCFAPEANAYRQDKTYFGKFDKPPYARGNRKPGYTQDFSIISMI